MYIQCMFIFTLLYFLLGVNPHTSLVNMHKWLDSVANECNLSCCCRTTGFKGVNLAGIYCHLSPGEASSFIKMLQLKLMLWSALCTSNGTSAGSVVRAESLGKGLLSVEPVLIGPFQD